MNNWFVMHTEEGKEEQALELMQRKLSRKLWRQCRILYKEKLLRTNGSLLCTTQMMFPGYIFIQTDYPEELKEELIKARQFPKLLGNEDMDIIAVEDKDLHFLQNICGENLQYTMGLSEVEADEEGNITCIHGVLKRYAGQITKKRLRKRYVLAEVPLFNRMETVLFGIVLPDDRIMQERCGLLVAKK